MRCLDVDLAGVGLDGFDEAAGAADAGAAEGPVGPALVGSALVDSVCGCCCAGVLK